MSLLDDVSIVVTPNGYKAGELYAVVPVPTEGAELVTNGDFSSDASWTKGTGWTISGGTATCDGTQTGNSNLYQAPFYVAGKRYKTKLTVNSISGTLKVFTGTAVQVLTITSAGDYEVIALSSSTTLYLQSTASTTVEIDNVSVKEYTAADMDVTRETAATRVDEAGLVNYAEIIGSEEITNGDFATDTDWAKSSGWTISGGKATYDGTGGTSSISQNQQIELGKTYRVTIDVISNQGGGANTIFIGNDQANSSHLAVGTHTFLGTSTSGDGFNIYGRSGEVFEIDNVSLKEVTRDNVPRIDYSGGGCPHILAEPQRTNLVTYSEDFSQSAWVKSGVTLTSNYSTSPDGTLNATRVTGSSSNSLLQSFVYFSNESQTVIVSFYAKGTGKFRIKNTQGNVVDNYSSNYDATSDWERYSYTITNTSSSSGVQIVGIAGNSTGAAYDLSIWGMQLEIGSFPTSIIPTSGSTVTRNQDIFSRDGIGSLINSTEGVLFAELSALANDGLSKRITLADGSISNRVSLELDETANKIKAFISRGGASQILEYTAPNLLQFNKIGIKWKENDFALWFNGNEVATDSSGNVPIGLTELVFEGGNSFSTFFGKVKQLQVYKTALTDEQLIQLTGTSGTDFYESYAEMASALTYTIQ